MDNVFDYLKWRGDLSFLENSINEVDSLIFCAFSYLKLEKVLQSQEFVTIKELYKRYKSVEEDTIFKKNQNRLFQMLSGCNRFKDITVGNYFNKVDEKKIMQIAGMVFLLPNETLFVAFRGTDETITGWKEDFNMSVMNIIPAEKQACIYLNEILSMTKRKVYVGGHSKGGNLAMYAALFCDNDENILKVYNHDGPGFSKEILKTVFYQKRKNKIVTFIPKASIIGNILNQDTKTFIIKSKQIGFLQHDLYSWLVYNNRFIYTNELSPEAKKISGLLNEAIEKIPKEEKKKMLTFVYDILNIENIDTIKKIIENPTLLKRIFEKYNFAIKDLPAIKNIISLIIAILNFITNE